MNARQLKLFGLCCAGIAMVIPYMYMLAMWLRLVPPSPQGGDSNGFMMIAFVVVMMTVALTSCYKARSATA